MHMPPFIGVTADAAPLNALQSALERYQASTRKSGDALTKRAFMGFVYGNGGKGGVNKGIAYKGFIDRLRQFEQKGVGISAFEMLLRGGATGIKLKDAGRPRRSLKQAIKDFAGAKSALVKISRTRAGGVKAQVVKRAIKGIRRNATTTSSVKRLNLQAYAAAKELQYRMAARKSMVAAMLFKRGMTIADRRLLITQNIAKQIRGRADVTQSSNQQTLIVTAMARGFDKPRAKAARTLVMRDMVRDIDAYLADREKRNIEAALKKQQLSTI